MTKKKILLAVSALVLIAVVGSACFFAYYVYGYTVAEDYTYVVKDALGESVADLPPYDRLASGLKAEISREAYDAPKTADELLLLFEKINAVGLEANFFQKLSVNSTDQGKTKTDHHVVEADNGKKYRVRHHIDVASTLFFEPVIVGWRIDIEEIE
ncbi:MAG: hypothetical protein NC084_08385 [Bacteroides sp.]|nr:hypothetical protein [Eubacterium sp.]MCM1418660.1 hypothetical protein [Roseburia sp.]MCM1462714.1 hypothetical protein [Bacteroides sp.]